MSLRSNIFANYTSQLYATGVGIAVVPLYIKYMGAEAYGLVGIFTMLQAWFSILDMGLTPTMARESARFNGGALSAKDYRALSRALEAIFAGIAIAGGCLLFANAWPISAHWLNASHMATHEIATSIRTMAFIVALRWMSGLYRGIITGAERLVWLSGFNSLIATARFILVLPILVYIDSSVLTFFLFQLGVAFFELVGLAWMAYRLLPKLPGSARTELNFSPIKPLIKFSMSVAFTASVWVLVTQTDKLVLSKILTLADYGYFTVAILVASGIMLISTPISAALMPRMTRLQAEDKQEALMTTYRKATQLVTIIVIPAALTIIFFSPQILWAWTGDLLLVQKAAPVLSLYAIGYAFLAVGAFPYYLQYAKGNLKLHLIGNLIFLILLIPSIIWAANRHGMTGAGWAWLITNVGYFLVWTPLVHRKFAPNIHIGWLADIVRPLLFPLIAAVGVRNFMIWSDDRVILALQLILTASVLLPLAYILATRIHKKPT